MLAIGSAERAEPTLVVDLCGDLPAVLGENEDARPGLSDWCTTATQGQHHEWDGSDQAREQLGDLVVEVAPDLAYLPLGTTALPPSAAPVLEWLQDCPDQLIIDCGVLDNESTSAAMGFRREVALRCDVSIVVLRQCFLTLRAMHNAAIEPTGVVLVREERRHLGRSDVEAAAGAPVIAEIAYDSSIFRSIDAGLARATLPRRLVRTLAEAVQRVA